LIAATAAISTIAAGAGAVSTSGPSSGGGSSSSRGPSSGGGGSSGGGSSGGGPSGSGSSGSGSSSREKNDALEGTDGLDINDHELDQVARRQAQKIVLAKTLNRKSNSQNTIGMNMAHKTRTVFNKLATEISKLSFTLAGSTIVLFTLSGQTRKVAMVATGIAIVLHFTNVFSEMRKELRDDEAMSNDTAIGN
jgi:hypothetical protein